MGPQTRMNRLEEGACVNFEFKNAFGATAAFANLDPREGLAFGFAGS